MPAQVLVPPTEMDAEKGSWLALRGRLFRVICDLNGGQFGP
jgi:hypothetical protein